METHIRFGEAPASGKNINYFSGESEVGISVFDMQNGKSHCFLKHDLFRVQLYYTF